jgi:phosphinothricin acetyltransferase
MDAVHAIYKHYVLNSVATFEEIVPSVSEMTNRWRALAEQGLPYLIATDPSDAPLGYAYAALYRTRVAYRATLEDTIYLAPDAVGHGLGAALLAELIDQAETVGARQMVGVIAGANEASVSVHRGAGFQTVGVLKAVGFKFGAWVDTTLMQRPIGSGAKSPLS